MQCVLMHNSDDTFYGDLITDDYFGRKVIRTALREKMPSYMVPKRVIFLDELPVTNNGKLDRKRLREMA